MPTAVDPLLLSTPGERSHRDSRATRTVVAVGLAAVVTASLSLAAPAPAGAAPGDLTVAAVTPVTTPDGKDAAVTLALTVAGGAPSTRDVVIHYSTGQGTATAGTDYTPAQGTITFPAGSASGSTRQITVAVARTAGPEVAETVPVVLSSSSPDVAVGRQPVVVINGHGLPYLDARRPVVARVRDLLARMTLPEKIGQMTQAERSAVNRTPEVIADRALGSLLSGGGSTPAQNNPTAWADMIDGFQSWALSTRLQIPLIYGIDSVHGHGNLKDSTVFPHNVGLGATRDPALVAAAAQVTATETRATGIPWAFAPCVCVSRDTRWGRSYESFGEDPALVAFMGTAIDGLQGPGARQLSRNDRVLATAKHFAGDGGTAYGSAQPNAALDQGVVVTDRATFDRLHLAPYVPAVRKHRVGSIMPSYSSVDWTSDGVGNPIKMHANADLIQGWLKDEIGFDGFVISDYNAISQLPGAYPHQVATAVNAGIDMAMEPNAYAEFQSALLAEVNAGRVTVARIDDAVRRILTKKFELGLFERPYADRSHLAEIGSAAHRAVARRAVGESQVLLKNADGALPLKRDSRIYVAGRNADDIGNQAGGWTIGWQGQSGPITRGTTILQGLREVAPTASITYSRDASAPTAGSDVGVVVVGETPYAEGYGDVGGPVWPWDPTGPREPKSMSLVAADRAAIDRVCTALPTCVVLVVSGRPQVLTDQLPRIDALVASWLPGTEGAGVADVLFGRRPFTGQLPQSWPRSTDGLGAEPINVGDPTYAPLYPFGWGLTTAGGATQGPGPAAVTALRQRAQERVGDAATGVPAPAADLIARADQALLAGSPATAILLLRRAQRLP